MACADAHVAVADALCVNECRLRREDEASVVRLRWYGPRSLKPDHKIYVEKKVHREPWTNEQGYKASPHYICSVMLHIRS